MATLQSNNAGSGRTQPLIAYIAKAMKPGHGPGEPCYPDILELPAQFSGQQVVNLDELPPSGQLLLGESGISSDTDHME